MRRLVASALATSTSRMLVMRKSSILNERARPSRSTSVRILLLPPGPGLPRRRRFIAGLVSLSFAPIGLIAFDDLAFTAQGSRCSLTHCLTDAMRHEPCGFVGDAN